MAYSCSLSEWYLQSCFTKILFSLVAWLSFSSQFFVDVFLISKVLILYFKVAQFIVFSVLLLVNWLKKWRNKIKHSEFSLNTSHSRIKDHVTKPLFTFNKWMTFNVNKQLSSICLGIVVHPKWRILWTEVE